LRALADVPSIDLVAIERGGAGRPHTIERHVARTAAELMARGRASGHAASSYPDVATAQRVVDRALRGAQPAIARWLASGRRPHLPISVRGDSRCGVVYDPHRDGLVATAQALVVLERDPAPPGYTVLTTYPTLESER
jgi:hypothetical protein